MVLVAVFCVAQLFYYGKNLSAGDHGFFSSAWTAVIGAGMNGGEGNGGIMGGNGTAGQVEAVRMETVIPAAV